MKTLLVFTKKEIQTFLPYALLCETREGSKWNTMHRKRRWEKEFTSAERKAASTIFEKAHAWYLTTGLPEAVKMTPETYSLWQKLENFCASI